MASFDFTLPVAEFGAALRRTSIAVQQEASTLLRGAAESTKRDVQAAYPVGPTGNLRRQVFLTQPRSFGASAYGMPIPVVQVRAAAKHVHLYQRGTGPRYDATHGNAYRGVMPKKGDVFQAIAAQHRDIMHNAMRHLLDGQHEVR